MAKSKWKSQAEVNAEQTGAGDAPVQAETTVSSSEKESDAKTEKKYRYEVGLAKEKDPTCFVGFFETNSLAEAKESCIQKAEAEGRECILRDTREFGESIIFRHGRKEAKDAAPAATVVPTKPPAKYKITRA